MHIRLLNHSDFRQKNKSLKKINLLDSIAESVKLGNISLSERLFSLVDTDTDSPLFRLYKGRFLSQKRDFKAFEDYCDVYSKDITDMTPFYWRQGIAKVAQGNLKSSMDIFNKMWDSRSESSHEYAHYYQCLGAVELYVGKNVDRVQETLNHSMDLYLRDQKSNEQFYSSFDNVRCVLTNIIMQIIIDLKNQKAHIAYRKLLYCRNMIQKHKLPMLATGISEISSLFLRGEFKWVFNFLFTYTPENIIAEHYVPNPDVLNAVIKERDNIGFNAISAQTIEGELSLLRRDYLLLNNFPREKYTKSYFFHLEGISMETKKVFIIYGRNTKLYRELIAFITSLRLDPIEWEQAVSMTRHPSPYIGEVIDTAFDKAQALIVLLTPDEKVQLVPELQTEDGDDRIRDQARPNVIFEAGYAMGKYPDKTILVTIGTKNVWSDIQGIHTVKLSNDTSDRQKLIDRLKLAGCDIDITGSTAWQNAGTLEL